MTPEELEPCPFCGGEAVRITLGHEEPNNAGGDVIGCQQCGASSHVEFGRKENLVSRWNTRPAISSLRAQLAAVEAETERRIVEWLRSNPNIPFKHGPSLTHDAHIRDIADSIEQGNHHGE